MVIDRLKKAIRGMTPEQRQDAFAMLVKILAREGYSRRQVDRWGHLVGWKLFLRRVYFPTPETADPTAQVAP